MFPFALPCYINAHRILVVGVSVCFDSMLCLNCYMPRLPGITGLKSHLSCFVFPFALPACFASLYATPARDCRFKITSQLFCVSVCFALLYECTQDIGCGVGGPAREMARFSGASVVGLNICDYQLKRAQAHLEKSGLKHLVSFQKVSEEDYLCSAMYTCLIRRRSMDDNLINGKYVFSKCRIQLHVCSYAYMNIVPKLHELL